MRRQVPLYRSLAQWIGPAVLLMSALFLLGFAVGERQGLGRLIRLLGDALTAIPVSLRTLITYYADLSAGALLTSILIGLATGAGLSLLNSRASSDRWRIIAAGTIGGAIGSQLLTYPTRHCTYLADAETGERWIGVAITAVGAAIITLTAWMLAGRRLPRARATSGYYKGISLPLLFLFPTLLSLIVFLYYPATQIVTLSLNAQPAGLPVERFVCLANYIDLPTDPIYRSSFVTTLTFTMLITAFSMAIALGIALLASQKVRGASLYRPLLIWPYALSPVVTAVIFQGLFREGRAGLINTGLYEVLGTTLDWLTDPQLAPITVIAAAVWNALGFNILFYIAGLQNVPKDLLEAAQIDGANRFQRFVRITLPMLSPFTFFLLVTNITFSFYGIYGAIDTLTQGGPPLFSETGTVEGYATGVLIYRMYEDAFRTPGAPAGAAAAQALILFLLVAAITVIQFRYLERRVTYSA
jgi:sn-glycerol 3-phosphate transport system permease protein